MWPQVIGEPGAPVGGPGAVPALAESSDKPPLCFIGPFETPKSPPALRGFDSGRPIVYGSAMPLIALTCFTPDFATPLKRPLLAWPVKAGFPSPADDYIEATT